MPERKSAFIKIDELLPQVTLEQAAEYYGVQLPEIRRIGDEVRMRCFLACGRTEETGDRAIAVQVNNPVKPWKCHVYQCQKGGNLVGLCDLMKPGENGGGRPRGERFKQIAADIMAMVGGEQASTALSPRTAPRVVKEAREKSPVNVPLAESDNERARELVNLDEQFITDVAAMPPEASAYFRRRPFLTPEVCQRFRMGYLPQSAKSLLRGKIVYPYFSANGQLLTWFGRDPRYEEKHRHWAAGNRAESEPVKTQFVKGFHRGLELWGEHWLRAEDGPKPQPRVGLVLVEGPNDAINLQTLGTPAVALCSNTITKEQVERVTALAAQLDTGLVTLMLDCDEEGENGVAQALPLLAERVSVRLPWRRPSHGGKFKDRQPEQLITDEWKQLAKFAGS